jgi:hypothetical protein
MNDEVEFMPNYNEWLWVFLGFCYFVLIAA